MNGTMAGAVDLVAEIEAALQDDAALLEACDFLVCPSYLHIPGVLGKAQSVAVGAQDCSDHADGAVTGQVSAAMLKDAGCSHVILGHSECREYRGEESKLIAVKADKALQQKLHVILCVGESEEERDAGGAKSVVKRQLQESLPAGAQASNITIAYEPVWAIGTGKVASVQDIEDMHGFIREELAELALDYENVRILYGGSMKPENAAEILALPNVDGGLIGGASLDAAQFIAIGRAALD